VTSYFSYCRREVTIHVCDDGRDERRDFTCPQSLLLERMGYFSDVVQGQNLEDVDISVHCDVEVFDWLIHWIKSEDDGEPALTANNVMSILVSASFLKV